MVVLAAARARFALLGVVPSAPSGVLVVDKPSSSKLKALELSRRRQRNRLALPRGALPEALMVPSGVTLRGVWPPERRRSLALFGT